MSSSHTHAVTSHTEKQQKHDRSVDDMETSLPRHAATVEDGEESNEILQLEESSMVVVNTVGTEGATIATMPSAPSSIIPTTTPSSSSSASEEKVSHLFVCSHGFMGNPNHLKHVIRRLREAHSDKIIILNSSRNNFHATLDGIEVCAERLIAEIKETLEKYPSVRKITIIGYSLGGLLTRYAIGQLYLEGFFEKIEPMNYISFATPHLGARKRGDSTFNHLWNFISPKVSYKSGMQMFLTDEHENNMPLLLVMSLPEGPYFRGLQLFKNIMAYSNIQNDRTVPFTSAAIISTNPFRNLRNFDIAANYPHIIAVADLGKNPSEVWESLNEKVTIPVQRGKKEVRKKGTLELILGSLTFIVVGIPLGSVLLIVALFLSLLSLFSRFTSKRVQRKLNCFSQHASDRMEEKESLLPTTITPVPTTTATTMSPTSPSATTSTEEKVEAMMRDDDNHSEVKLTADSPKEIYDFYECRLKIIENLNKLPWKKVAVRLDSLNTHSTIIVRSELLAKLMPMGTDVVNHFIENLVL